MNRPHPHALALFLGWSAGGLLFAWAYLTSASGWFEVAAPLVGFAITLGATAWPLTKPE